MWKNGEAFLCYESLDAIQLINDGHGRTNGIRTVSGLNDNECSESIVDRSSENS